MSGKLSSTNRRRRRRLALANRNRAESNSDALTGRDVCVLRECVGNISINDNGSYMQQSDDKENTPQQVHINVLNQNNGSPKQTAVKSGKFSTKRRWKMTNKRKCQQLQEETPASRGKVKWRSPIVSSKENRDKKVSTSKEQQLSSNRNRISVGVVKSLKRNRLNNSRKENPTDDSFNVYYCSLTNEWIIKRKKSTFRKGETMVPNDPKYAGFAFTIGERRDKKSAECHHVWMRAENTYLGVQLKELGYEWVLVKKHHELPIQDVMNSRIVDLKYLWNAEKLATMDASTALYYEEENPTSFAYYFEPGRQLNTHQQPFQKPPKAMDLCAGGGGMSVGLREAGFNVQYKVDSNETACETLKSNFFDSQVYTSTLAEFLDRLKNGRINIDLSSILLIHGSPPCQGFSRVNSSGGTSDAINAKCTLDFVEIVKFVRPPFVTMENVPGLCDDAIVHGTNKSKNSYLKQVISDLILLGYSVRLCKAFASEFGDPTKRERVIMFASKRGWKLPSCPLPTHGTKEEGLLPVVTCSDVLKELEIDPVSDDALITLEDGRSVWGHFVEKTTLTEKYEGYDSLIADRPAITIRKKNPVKHYSDQRFITILERLRLMSFPYNYIFEGSHQDCCDQIGNAVPVKLAEAIGKAVMDSFRLGRHETSV